MVQVFHKLKSQGIQKQNTINLNQKIISCILTIFPVVFETRLIIVEICLNNQEV